MDGNERHQEELRGVLARMVTPDGYEAFRRQVYAAGGCSHPVRLRGRVETRDEHGRVVESFDTRTMPDGVILKACGNRRASVCPTCSDTYRQDARQLVAAGLQGGKGVPGSVAQSPALFVTLTGPSFGAVHTASPKRACKPGSPGKVCPHGRPTSCFERHDHRSPVCGEPLCADCYRYDRHVIWNALSAELWRRTGIYLRRKLAKVAGLSPTALDEELRISFLKVVEFQRRGAVHVHAVIRADGREGPGSPLPQWLAPAMLVAALREAVAAVYVEFPSRLGGRVAPKARWGKVMDVSLLSGEQAARRAARYVSKYVTKGTDSSGVLDRRLKETDVEGLSDKGLSEHQRRLVSCAWDLGAKPELRDLGLRRNAHQLGYRGHVLTKSRRYSTTLTALRQARADHRRQEALAKAGAVAPQGVAKGRWRLCGIGYKNSGDAMLARHWGERVITARLFAHGLESPYDRQPPDSDDHGDYGDPDFDGDELALTA